MGLSTPILIRQCAQLRGRAQRCHQRRDLDAAAAGPPIVELTGLT